MLLQLGDKGQNVTFLQYGLHIVCYSTNGFDGDFGNGTFEAVKKFQSRYGLSIDGIVGDSTWDRLKGEIYDIQSQLTKKGFNLMIDGIAGESTYTKVIEFQKAKGLVPDGMVGNATRDALFDSHTGGNSFSRILKVTTPYMQGDDVKSVQIKLNSLGYNIGAEDGIYGNGTADGVRAFQNSKGLDTDGIVGAVTWQKLFSSSNNNGYTRILKVSSPLMYGDDIKLVQNKLNSLGFSVGSPDGYYGNGTADGVKTFQKAKGIEIDGIVGPTTWKLLFGDASSGNSGFHRLIKITSPLMYGEDIRAIQIKLNSLGFNVGLPDGYYGNGTAEGVKKFQLSRGILSDGIVGEVTWDRLFNSSTGGYTRILKVTTPYMQGDDVTEVQSKLAYLGYLQSVIDGIYGNGTADAVKNFQRSKGLDIDGIVGPATWNTLFSTNGGSTGGGSVGGGNVKKVFIDAGHGGSDPGASGYVIERDVVLNIALKLGNILESKGISVKYSRTSNSTFVGLTERAVMANNWGADVFVSIHGNSNNGTPGTGTETYIHTTGSNSSRTLASKVTNKISSSLSLSNRGVKTANFAVLREANMPAILVETAFVNNSNDASKLKNNPFGFANAIAEAILGHSVGEDSEGNTAGDVFVRDLKLTTPLMYGEDVKYMQKILNELGYDCGIADGYFGNKLKIAVEEFQRVFLLSINGQINKSVWSKIVNAKTNTNDILVYSTFRVKGWKQPNYLNDGSQPTTGNYNKTRVANDMTYNDFTKDQILKLNPNFTEADFNKSIDDHISTFKSMVKLLSMNPLQDVAMDIIDRFTTGANYDFINSTLTEKVSSHFTTVDYFNKVRDAIRKELEINNGNINALRYIRANDINGNVTNLTKKIANLTRPVFNTLADRASGLQILINDTWANTVRIKNYKLTGKEYTCTVILTIYDHFGLDVLDVEPAKPYAERAGFRSWFILQHYKNYNGKHKPLPTVMEIPFEIKGTIK